MISQRRYNNIDLLKLIMAICVIAIHTRPLYNCGNITVTRVYDSVVGIANPVFFLSTGFLIGKKFFHRCVGGGISCSTYKKTIAYVYIMDNPLFAFDNLSLP